MLETIFASATLIGMKHIASQITTANVTIKIQTHVAFN